ncbi:MAG: M56 family metallopeptidase [Oscillospiraceae bacterium]|nr:M56 family metallopeptidase [Oscillospiraceae bacterium]
MSQLFTNILTASLYGSIVILLVLLLRLVLKKIPKSVICLLWLLTGLRLILPFEIESRISLQPDLEITQPQPTISVNAPMTPDGTVLSQLPEQDLPLTSDTPDIVIQSIDYWEIGTIVWLSGVGIMGICSLISYLRLKRQVREAIRTEGNIWKAYGLDTAFVLGLFRPRIYIPANLEPRNRHFVVAHERAHIARRDHWYKPIGYLILAIHWFNPLVWLAYVLLCRDIEMACDEQVIRSMNTEQRKAYSTALLSCSTKYRGIAACPLAFGEGSVKQRIISVLNYRKPGFWVILIGLIALVFVSVCFLTSPLSHNSLKWAQNLSAADIQSAELYVSSALWENNFHSYTDEELEDLAAFIRESHGSYSRNTEELTGGVTVITVTMKDGSQHVITNEGNCYLNIDGDRYEADYAWLASWPKKGDTSSVSHEKLAKCKEALEVWQSCSSYYIRIDSQHEGDLVLNDSSTTEYWKSGSVWLRNATIETPDFTLTHLSMQKDGALYTREINIQGEGTSDTDWNPDSFAASELLTPWPMSFEWEDQTIRYQNSEAAMGEELITLAVTDGDTPSTLNFYFDRDGTLETIVRIYTMTIAASGDAVSSQITETVQLLSTDEAEIMQMVEEQYPLQ